MKEKNSQLSIGELIRKKFEESGLTVAEFARRIHTSRRNVYQIFTKNSIDTDMLYNISKVLGKDWIVEYFIQKYDYKLPQKTNEISDDLFNTIIEYMRENKRTLNEIKALQHLILEHLEKKKNL